MRQSVQRLSWKYYLAIALVLICSLLIGSRVAAMGKDFFDDIGSTVSNCDVYNWRATVVTCTSRAVNLKATNTAPVPKGITTARIYFRNVPTLATGRPNGADIAFTANAGQGRLQFTIEGGFYCPNYIAVPGANQSDGLTTGYYGPGGAGAGTLANGRHVTDFYILNDDGSIRSINNIGEYRSGFDRCDPGGTQYERQVYVNPDNLKTQPGFPLGVFYVELLVQPDTRIRPTGYDGSFFDNVTSNCSFSNSNNCDGIANAFKLSQKSIVAAEQTYEYLISTGSKATGGAEAYNVTFQIGNRSLDSLANNDPNKHSSYAMRFGADCLVAIYPGGFNTKLTLYDVDHGNDSVDPSTGVGDYAKAVLMRESGTGAKYVARPGAFNGTAAGGPIDALGNWVPVTNSATWAPNYNANESIPIPSASNSNRGISFRSYPGDKYILYFMGVRSDVVNQYGLPFDGIYYNQPCPTPTSLVTPEAIITLAGSSVPLNPGGYVDAGTNVTASGRLINSSPNNTGYVNASWISWLDNGDGVSGGASDRTLDITPAADYSIVPGGPLEIGTFTTLADGAYAQICSKVYNLNARNPSPTTPTVTSVSASFDVTCIPIQRRPYFEVMNGDVNATASLQTTCTSGVGTISAFNTTGPPGRGSRSEIAAYALGNITGFWTADGYNRGIELSFANTSGGGVSGNFGQAYCIPNDFWASATDTTSDKTLVNTQQSVVTNGDVYIEAPFAYSSTFSSAAIPYRLIAARNIYILGTVNRLDGVYAAKENIYTCATGSGTSMVAANVGNMRTECNTQLTVNGAFVAGGGVKLLRTFDTLSGQPAERFIYSPEVWLQAIQGRNTSGTFKTDSITSLPPIL